MSSLIDGGNEVLSLPPTPRATYRPALDSSEETPIPPQSVMRLDVARFAFLWVFSSERLLILAVLSFQDSKEALLGGG